ncbi:MAG: HAMP domain-containing sensor histidine kinase [Deltaproteobacteria bacterium]
MSRYAALAALDTGAIVFDARGEVVFADERAQRTLRIDGLVGRRIEQVLTVRPRLAEHPLVRRVSRFDDGGETHFVVQLVDAEDAATERDRLLVLASVSEFLPIVLHELKNPLAAVQTALELAIEDASDDLVGTLHPILHEIRRASRSLLGMGSVGLTLRTSHHQAIDLAIDEAAGVLVPTASEAGVRIERDVHSMPLLPFDAGVTRAIVFNLVKNAIDAGRRGDVVYVAADYTDDALHLTVRDTGPGMAPDVVERCTSPFFTTKSGGSGIGLALCLRAVEGAGGRFDLTSALDEGTSVMIRVPVTSA